MGAMHPRLRCVGCVFLYLCSFLHTLMALPWGWRLQKRVEVLSCCYLLR